MDSAQVKPGINLLMIIGFIISIFGTLCGFATIPVVGIVLGLFTMINLIGMILSIVVANRIGPNLVIIGNVIFVPIGLIGVLGGRQVLDKMERMRNLKNDGPQKENT